MPPEMISTLSHSSAFLALFSHLNSVYIQLYNTVNYMGPERTKYSCKTKAAKRQQDQVVVDAICKEKVLDLSSRLDKPQSAICIPVPIETQNHTEFLDVDFGHDDPVTGPVPTFNQDDIKIEYHPSSSIEAKVYGFDSFEHHASEFLVPPPDGQPWHPFKSRLKFEIAEIMLEVGFNNQQSDRFIKLCHRCAVGKEKFTFKNHKDIHNMWEAASHHITKFTKEVISIPFAGDEELREYDFDGNTFVSFVDEPFTARDIWDVQSQLPPDKTLLLWYHKRVSSLRSFSKLTDCNSKRVRCRQRVKDEKLHSGKPSWVDFKNTVWHKSFARIISSLASKSQMGQWFKCLDGVTHWFSLCILILSADFEEHCELLNVINAARAKETFEEREELLKEQALHLIDNTFWAVAFTCMFRALSHDRCHFNHGGLWSCHLWVELQKYIVTLGRGKVSQVDNRFEKFPCWRNLKHPNQVVSVTFTDSSVHKDISKMIIYATHDVLTKNDSPLGYFLLRCVHLYLEMDVYAALEVHTTNTIEEGRHTVQAFTALIKQYMTQTADDNLKNWNFPKLHMTTHIFDDIEAKGASCDYNTKPNEQMHGPLKDWYLNWTNFKNIAEQRKSDGENDDSLDDDENTDIDVDISTLDWSQHVTEYQFLRVNYESLVDWKQDTDGAVLDSSTHHILTVSSSWTQNGVILGHLVFLFQCAIGNDLFPLALIHPFDALTGPLTSTGQAA
ncbi:uncharacterized protein F5147DRAFT_649883 [Suillus discolor]|uniref:Transposase n=1 Tax=Suillus discolor TaxID=1912936 RepID=A0A9P7JXA8_9AGAM|nr:uncharacterized protein F5147DRAFT_649883 [Suillus discolor]KAG2114730.1 hypothetical protein F5147DRAFT_649883 [Suillus discolor]